MRNQKLHGKLYHEQGNHNSDGLTLQHLLGACVISFTPISKRNQSLFHNLPLGFGQDPGVISSDLYSVGHMLLSCLVVVMEKQEKK